MQEEMKTLLEEGKEFVDIKRTFDAARFPEAGAPAWIIATEWLNNYKKYIFYDELRYNMNPKDHDDDHLTSKHPGKIINAELLHKEDKFLKGTGEVADLETEVMD